MVLFVPSNFSVWLKMAKNMLCLPFKKAPKSRQKTRPVPNKCLARSMAGIVTWLPATNPLPCSAKHPEQPLQEEPISSRFWPLLMTTLSFRSLIFRFLSRKTLKFTKDCLSLPNPQIPWKRKRKRPNYQGNSLLKINQGNPKNQGTEGQGIYRKRSKTTQKTTQKSTPKSTFLGWGLPGKVGGGVCGWMVKSQSWHAKWLAVDQSFSRSHGYRSGLSGTKMLRFIKR